MALAHLDVKDTIKETIGVLLDKDAEKSSGGYRATTLGRHPPESEKKVPPRADDAIRYAKSYATRRVVAQITN